MLHFSCLIMDYFLNIKSDVPVNKSTRQMTYLEESFTSTGLDSSEVK